jgi:hypothetical protein
MVSARNPAVGLTPLATTMRSMSGTGGRLRMNALTRLKIVALTAMPSPSVTMATAAKPGRRTRRRAPNRTSCQK